MDNKEGKSGNKGREAQGSSIHGRGAKKTLERGAMSVSIALPYEQACHVLRPLPNIGVEAEQGYV